MADISFVQVADGGDTMVIDDVASESGYLARSGQVRAEIAAPLIFDGVLRGVLDIDAHQRAPFGDADRVFLENVGDLVALRLSLGGA